MNFNDAESPFYLPLRVYLEDTDAGGVVFYANYLKFFERARTEFVRHAGFQMRRSIQSGISFVVSSVSVDYKKPCYLDDEIRVYVSLTQLKKSYFEVRQWVSLEQSPLDVRVEGCIKVACVHLDSGKPRAMPEELTRAFTS